MAAPPPELKQGQQHKLQRSRESERSSERFSPPLSRSKRRQCGTAGLPDTSLCIGAARGTLTIARAICLRGSVEFSRHFARNAGIASAHFDKSQQYLFGQRRPTALRQQRPVAIHYMSAFEVASMCGRERGSDAGTPAQRSFLIFKIAPVFAGRRPVKIGPPACPSDHDLDRSVRRDSVGQPGLLSEPAAKHRVISTPAWTARVGGFGS
jgi:hypothetical protein